MSFYRQSKFHPSMSVYRAASGQINDYLAVVLPRDCAR